jgi:electron transport complex protein RnfD
MNLNISSSPHTHCNITTKKIMLHVIIALVPAMIASIIFFRHKALFLLITCTITSIICEELITRVRKKPSTISDLSASVSGILLALILPPATTWYAAILASVFAIIIAKQLFGGLGANIFNPALMGRAFLMAAYPAMMTTYCLPYNVDAISGPTPLALNKFSHVVTSSWDLFIGNIPGSLGETSALCLIIGGAYLLLLRIADWRIPLSLIITSSIIAIAGHAINPNLGSMTFHLLSGGMLLGAFFMATDPATTPITKTGRYIFGIGCGIMIMILRYKSGLPEGVMYSILFMNCLTPLINRYTRPRRFGL